MTSPATFSKRPREVQVLLDLLYDSGAIHHSSADLTKAQGVYDGLAGRHYWEVEPHYNGEPLWPVPNWADASVQVQLITYEQGFAYGSRIKEGIELLISIEQGAP